MIRHATEDDIPHLVQMGRRFLHNSPYHAYLADNPERMAELGRTLLNGAGGMLVSEQDGVITGMLGYVIHTHFISGERFAGEVFWWVELEARGDGIKLLRAAEQEARAAGAKVMQMIAPDERVSAVYRHFGYDFIESTYQRAL